MNVTIVTPMVTNNSVTAINPTIALTLSSCLWQSILWITYYTISYQSITNVHIVSNKTKSVADKKPFIGKESRPTIDLNTSLSELNIGDLIDIVASAGIGGGIGSTWDPDYFPPTPPGKKQIVKVLKDHKDAREGTGGERIFPEISNIYRSIDQLTDMVIDIEKRLKR